MLLTKCLSTKLVVWGNLVVHFLLNGRRCHSLKKKKKFLKSSKHKKRDILLVGSQTFGVRSEIVLVSNMASRHSKTMHSDAQ